MRDHSESMYAMLPDDKDTSQLHDWSTDLTSECACGRETLDPMAAASLIYRGYALLCVFEVSNKDMRPDPTFKTPKEKSHFSTVDALNAPQKFPHPTGLNILAPLTLHSRNETSEQFLDLAILDARAQGHDAAVLLF